MPIIRRRTVLRGLMLAPVIARVSLAYADQPVDPLLQQMIDSPRRSPADRARDIYRHPGQSLTFWGLKRGDTVIDVSPGAGWWTDIIAPYLAASHGRYIAAGADIDSAGQPQTASRDHPTFASKYLGKSLYGDVSIVGFGRASGPLAPPGTVDLVLVSREMHNWVRANGFLQKTLADFHAALKPNGVLAIEEHRAPDGADPAKGDGYLSEAFVIAEAAKGGFSLAGRSEINANPKDTKDYPFGVWTLPPSRRSAPFGQPPNPAFDHAPYDAIGESDRMTLKFIRSA